MRLYPAIDLKNGQCVRLRQGKFEEIQRYSKSPEAVAKEYEDMGASWLHVVDLDGALAGYSINDECLKRIIDSVQIPVQIGGGIRTLADIEKKLKLGVSRVIIGTKAVESPQFIREVITAFGPEQIVIGIDAKDGMAAINGWRDVSSHTAISLALKMKELGVATIIYTDISKDGMMQGPNVERTKELLDHTGLCVIASGGISNRDDLDRLKEAKIPGAIIGKALYEHTIDLAMAINEYEKKEE